MLHLCPRLGLLIDSHGDSLIAINRIAVLDVMLTFRLVLSLISDSPLHLGRAGTTLGPLVIFFTDLAFTLLQDIIISCCCILQVS